MENLILVQTVVRLDMLLSQMANLIAAGLDMQLSQMANLRATRLDM